MIDIDSHETHTMRCAVCNKELQVNNNYNIESITCGECWAKANPRDVYYTQPGEEWSD